MSNIENTVFSILLVASVFFLFVLDKNRWMALIPIISTISYWFLIKRPDHSNTIRFTDMALTMPLMAVAIHYTYSKNLSQILTSILLILLSIMASIIGNNANNHKWYVLVGISLFAVLYEFLKMKDTAPVVYLLFVTWALYPLLWIFKIDGVLSPEQLSFCYSYIDVVSKIGIVDMLWIAI